MSTDVQQKLFETLAEVRLRNPSYSMRAFARRLGIGSSALSEILSGKRAMSYKMAARLLEKLDLEESEKGEILSRFTHQKLEQSPSDPEPLKIN